MYIFLIYILHFPAKLMATDQYVEIYFFADIHFHWYTFWFKYILLIYIFLIYIFTNIHFVHIHFSNIYFADKYLIYIHFLIFIWLVYILLKCRVFSLGLSQKCPSTEKLIWASVKEHPLPFTFYIWRSKKCPLTSCR